MALSLLHLVASTVVILTAAVKIGKCQRRMQEPNTTFGECQLDKASCQECYLGLVRALLGRDDNVFNLSQVFTPPTFDQPNSVIVNYRFFNECNDSNNSCVDEIHTWFWAESGAYISFIHWLHSSSFLFYLEMLNPSMKGKYTSPLMQQNVMELVPII